MDHSVPAPLLPLLLDNLDTPQVLNASLLAVMRPAGAADAAALRAFYLALRAPEFAGTGLPEAMFAMLLDGQFRAQQAAYTSQFRDLATFAVTSADVIVGRLMLASEPDARGARAVRIVDIALDGAWRGRGLGGAMLTRVAAAARTAGFAALALQVAVDNSGARRLYERLGFAACDGAPADNGISIEMRWDLAST